MADDIIRDHVGRVVVIEINQLSRPKYVTDGEIYVGRVRDYDGHFLRLCPYVKGRIGSDIEQTVEELTAQFEHVLENSGNLDPQQPEDISKWVIGRIRQAKIKENPDDEQRQPKR
jgi:hypothetical protein